MSAQVLCNEDQKIIITVVKILIVLPPFIPRPAIIDNRLNSSNGADMSFTTKSPSSTIFDRSYLPEAEVEFVVIGDTHYMLHPDAYAPEFDSARFWSARADWALRLAAALDSDFVVHLGDLAQEYPEKPDFVRSRREALAQMARHGLKPYHVAGNMDIGDKPDPTMPSEWVTPKTLKQYHDQFGRSWYSFDRHGIHGVVLNSQILNSPLPEAEEQKQWLETDLAEHAGERIFIFMHMPPFFVEEQEPDQGFYNSIDEPARGWLLTLLRRYKVEMLFSGHTHFTAFNRINGTRLYVTPSTTTSRAGFYEVFSVRPPTEQGRNDVAKLGFYLVRIHQDGARVHFIRTNGEIGPPENEKSARRLITRISCDLPDSPVGAYLRTPLAHVADGAIAWPGVIRQRVRDDHPFFACLELGLRHVRVPASDLADDLQSQRLGMLRDEGVQITGVWLLYERLNLAEAIKPHIDQIDAVEVQLPGRLWPEDKGLQAIERCRTEFNLPISLAPLLSREPATDKFHPRTRVGYRPGELPKLEQRLSQNDIRLDRVVGYVGAEADPWPTMQKFMAQRPLEQIANLDFVVGFPGLDEAAHACRGAEAVFTAALWPGCRLFLDPLVDLDRTNDINHGMLDRLSNPRPVFHAARCLNTILFGLPAEFRPIDSPTVETGRTLGLKSQTKTLWLLLPATEMTVSPQALLGAQLANHRLSCVDLVLGRSQVLTSGDELEELLTGIEHPLLLLANSV